MKSTRLVALGLMLSAAVAFGQTRPKAYVPKTPRPAASPETTALPVSPRVFINSVLDTGQFLPDTALLATVADREIRARDFVDAYFSSHPEYRPRGTYEGRLEFLGSMINKEVLGLTALAAGREFGFEERLTMRSFTQRTLSNAVYQYLVLDSVKVSEEALRAFYETQKYEQHFRHILFADRAVAASVAADLRARKISWDAAFKRYHVGTRATDLGWVTQASLPADVAVEIYSLPVGSISEPVQDRSWFHVFQSMERRPRPDVPLYESMRKMLRMTLSGLQVAKHAERVQEVLRRRIGMEYDTSAVVWVSTRFGGSNVSYETGPMGSPEVTINDTLPAFTPADTGRVLARWKRGQLTLSPLLKAYSDITPVSRPLMNTPDAVKAQVDALVLEPYMAEYAVELGIDKTPMVQRALQRKREEILVKHLFADSVESKIWISKAERQKYYNDRPLDFTTYPMVVFAAFSEPTRSACDSLVARLKSGEKAADILRADSLAGFNRGSIQTRTSEEHGPYQKLLFEELRPGQTRIEGPDRQGDYVVLQLISFDPGHLLPYEQVEGLIDESLQNIRGEQALNAILERAKKGYRIVVRPELLDRVKLVDPTLDE
ncbi:MAG: peptidyl-prolyl cis-trans isomerase [Candidatus Eisenbacteria bacterium]|nr:peptidyl-prolyl cis-trans isomerase [Candidatus Eisenbacteria bacterium]